MYSLQLLKCLYMYLCSLFLLFFIFFFLNKVKLHLSVIPLNLPVFSCTVTVTYLYCSLSQINFPMCTIASMPRLPEHCIEYVRILQWPKDQPFGGITEISFDLQLANLFFPFGCILEGLVTSSYCCLCPRWGKFTPSICPGNDYHRIERGENPKIVSCHWKGNGRESSSGDNCCSCSCLKSAFPSVWRDFPLYLQDRN